MTVRTRSEGLKETTNLHRSRHGKKRAERLVVEKTKRTNQSRRGTSGRERSIVREERIFFYFPARASGANPRERVEGGERKRETAKRAPLRKKPAKKGGGTPNILISVDRSARQT